MGEMIETKEEKSMVSEGGQLKKYGKQRED